MPIDKNSRILKKINESDVDESIKTLLKSLFLYELKHSDKKRTNYSKPYEKMIKDSME